jgi:hypothetical protein
MREHIGAGIAMRMGFRVRANTLFFEEIPLADLDEVRGLIPTTKDRLLALVEGIEGMANPEATLLKMGRDEAFQEVSQGMGNG